MDSRNVRYQRLPNDEDVVPIGCLEITNTPTTNAIAAAENSMAMNRAAGGVGMPMAPPPYVEDDDEEVNAENSSVVVLVGATSAATGLTPVSHGHPPPSGDAPKYNPDVPPSYVVATELPTYDQVQQFKLEEEHQPHESALDPEALERGDALLGTDFMFLCAFFVAFLFNWIGFLMLMCFCPTIAGRYGALAGFGLSLAKWTLIVKHSTELVSTENNWLWWLILAFGVLICVRAVLQYLHVKREWSLLTRATQERLMYFY